MILWITVELTPYDRVNSCFLCSVIKPQCAEHVSMVSDGKALHPQLFGFCHVTGNRGCSIKQGKNRYGYAGG